MNFFKQLTVISILILGVVNAMSGEKLVPLKTFKFLPELSDREVWEKIKNDPGKKVMIDKIFKAAEEAAATPIPVDSAKLFMNFIRNGERASYERNHFARRERLVNLVMAEALEYKGKYFNDKKVGDNRARLWQELTFGVIVQSLIPSSLN